MCDNYRSAHGLIQSRLARNMHLTFKIVANEMYWKLKDLQFCLSFSLSLFPSFSLSFILFLSLLSSSRR